MRTRPGFPGREGRCPYCDGAVKSEPGAREPSFPFCSLRCRMADLGRWFNEDYRVPGEPATTPDTPAEEV